MRAAAGKGAAVVPFPWARVIHTGLCLLRLSPKDFWAMTPREFFAASGGLVPRAPAFSRDGLAALMRAYPDTGMAKA
nr:rcc01693 family protein [Neorhizobium galegae]